MKPNTVAWFEVATGDADAAQEFYGELFGWTLAADPDAAKSGMDYRLISYPGGDQPVGGIFATGGSPPDHAVFSVAVADATDTCSRAEKLGGTVVHVEPKPKTLPPLNFTPDEAAALVVAMAVAGPTPLGHAAHTALGKIVAAMSPVARRGAAELVRRIRIPDSSPTTTPAGRVSTTVIGALAQRRLLDIDYLDRLGAATTRRVEPTGLITVDRRWYLVAWCRLRDDHRAFRLDRIQEATILLEAAPDRRTPPGTATCRSHCARSRSRPDLLRYQRSWTWGRISRS